MIFRSKYQFQLLIFICSQSTPGIVPIQENSHPIDTFERKYSILKTVLAAIFTNTPYILRKMTKSKENSKCDNV